MGYRLLQLPDVWAKTLPQGRKTLVSWAHSPIPQTWDPGELFPAQRALVPGLVPFPGAWRPLLLGGKPASVWPDRQPSSAHRDPIVHIPQVQREDGTEVRPQAPASGLQGWRPGPQPGPAYGGTGQGSHSSLGSIAAASGKASGSLPGLEPHPTYTSQASLPSHSCSSFSDALGGLSRSWPGHLQEAWLSQQGEKPTLFLESIWGAGSWSPASLRVNPGPAVSSCEPGKSFDFWCRLLLLL